MANSKFSKLQDSLKFQASRKVTVEIYSKDLLNKNITFKEVGSVAGSQCSCLVQEGGPNSKFQTVAQKLKASIKELETALVEIRGLTLASSPTPTP